MFKSSLQSKTAGLPSAIPFLTVLRSLLSKLFVCDSLNRLEFILLESFKVVSLFSFQCAASLSASATASISDHNFLFLSRTFFVPGNGERGI